MHNAIKINLFALFYPPKAHYLLSTHTSVRDYIAHTATLLILIFAKILQSIYILEYTPRGYSYINTCFYHNMIDRRKYNLWIKVHAAVLTPNAHVSRWNGHQLVEYIVIHRLNFQQMKIGVSFSSVRLFLSSLFFWYVLFGVYGYCIPSSWEENHFTERSVWRVCDTQTKNINLV